MQIGIPSLGRMPTIREPEGASMPLVAILDEEGQMTGITCPLNVGVDPHDIEGCEDLLESYFMQVLYLCCIESVFIMSAKRTWHAECFACSYQGYCCCSVGLDFMRSH